MSKLFPNLAALFLLTSAMPADPAIAGPSFGVRSVLNVLVVGLAIDGERINAIWDTGAPVSVMDEPPFRRLLGIPSESSIDGIFGELPILSPTGTLNIAFYGLDMATLHDVVSSPAVIGLDVMGKYQVILDFDQNRVSLTTEAIETTNFTFEVVEGRILIPVTITGRTYRAQIDTGLASVFMVPNAARFSDEPAVSYRGPSTITVEKVFLDTKDTRIDDIQVLGERFDTAVVPETPEAEVPYDLIVGAGFFHGGRLTFDLRYGTGQWLRTRPVVVNRVFLPFRTKERDGELRIASLRNDLAPNPFQLGDKILRINGRKIESTADLYAVVNRVGKFAAQVERDRTVRIINFEVP